jgi:hypothetical protein
MSDVETFYIIDRQMTCPSRYWPPVWFNVASIARNAFGSRNAYSAALKIVKLAKSMGQWCGFSFRQLRKVSNLNLYYGFQELHAKHFIAMGGDGFYRITTHFVNKFFAQRQLVFAKAA